VKTAIRTKTFVATNGTPLDRNAKCRVMAYARAWTASHRRPGQHKGPITRAFMEVLQALLWQFHNVHSGLCFPSYEAIALKAGCARSTVGEALKVLEWAGVLSWQHRLTKIRERVTDLFGREGWRWRVIRTSNSYAFADPKVGRFSSKSGNRSGTQNQVILGSVSASATAPDSPLEAALARFGAVGGFRIAHEEGSDPPAAA
jgi:hypothetical protein